MGWGRDGGNATYSDILPGSRQTTNPTLLASHPAHRALIEKQVGAAAWTPRSDAAGSLFEGGFSYLCRTGEQHHMSRHHAGPEPDTYTLGKFCDRFIAVAPAVGVAGTNSTNTDPPESTTSRLPTLGVAVAFCS